MKHRRCGPLIAHHMFDIDPIQACVLLTPLAEDTELVAFGVCQDNPRLTTLADINTLCAMSYQTSHLGFLVIRPEVEMQSALGLLALVKPDEVQSRQAIRRRADLELLVRGVDHNPTESLGPPLPQGNRICRVNNYLFPFQGHPVSLDPPGRRMTGPQASLIGLNPSTVPSRIHRHPQVRHAPALGFLEPAGLQLPVAYGPDGHATRRQLRAMGLRPGGQGAAAQLQRPAGGVRSDSAGGGIRPAGTWCARPPAVPARTL